MTVPMANPGDGGRVRGEDGGYTATTIFRAASGQEPPVTTTTPTTRDDRASISTSKRRHEAWWSIHPFRGMVNDVRRRAPYYASDWLDAWDYRVVPATIFIILPALAFSLDMFQNTGSNYGPLVIVGVTGPITVFNSTVYDIMKPTGVNYLGFMTWIGIWSLILHWILAITNSCNWLRWVTRFPCDIFGFYVAFIYLQKGIQVLERLGNGSAFYLSIVAALLLFMVAYICGELGGSNLFRHPVRVFLKDYGTPLTLVFFTGFVHFGRMSEIHLAVLPTSTAFEPTADRGWVVNFWDLSVGEVFTALPFAILLTILFWFDHNVSSLIAQGSEFPLRKPAGFHWDFFLLGITTGVAGILGLPFPNGLIPQAPFHTESLCVTKAVKQLDEKGEDKGEYTFEATHVVEQLKRRSAIWGFVIVELVGFGATFAITQTIAAVGFPIIILLLIPVRALVLPRIFHPDELVVLDEPTASDYIMEGIGGSWGGVSQRNEIQSSDDTPVASGSSSSSQRSGNHAQGGGGAQHGSLHKSQEDLAELGQAPNTQNMITRRRSIDKRMGRLRRGSTSSDAV
ncbi:hypothetical protein TrVGV298_011557 [Trichoderma virens]|nr:hypothetical protein TrVGV298_011557 [Trichoderma virens]